MGVLPALPVESEFAQVFPCSSESGQLCDIALSDTSQYSTLGQTPPQQEHEESFGTYSEKAMCKRWTS